MFTQKEGAKYLSAFWQTAAQVLFHCSNHEMEITGFLPFRDNSLIAVHIWANSLPVRPQTRRNNQQRENSFKIRKIFWMVIIKDITVGTRRLWQTWSIPFRRRSCLTNQGDDETNSTIPIFVFQLFAGCFCSADWRLWQVGIGLSLNLLQVFLSRCYFR